MAAAKAPKAAPILKKDMKRIKCSVFVDLELYARWTAAAVLRGQDKSAFGAWAIREATSGLVFYDRKNRPEPEPKPSQDVPTAEPSMSSALAAEEAA
jgi:hypothetical protein